MRLRRRAPKPPTPTPADEALDAARGRAVIEQSREAVVLLDHEDNVRVASRRARESLPELRIGSPLPTGARAGSQSVGVPLGPEVGNETLVYLDEPRDLGAYEELRVGFTAAVSHELRTPLARLLALLETAALPDADIPGLVDQARTEIEQIRELIDDVLFLGELETGRQVVSLISTVARPILDQVAESLAERAARAGVTMRIAGDRDLEVPLRPRMLRVIADNLAENAIRYAGPGATLVLSVNLVEGRVELRAADDGAGVRDEDAPRLFERFYRADRARASRGSGLGLAIVKHVVTAAGGSVEAAGRRGEGLEIRCLFPLPPQP